LNTRNAGSGAHITSYTRNHLGQLLTAVSPEVTYTYTYYTANNRLKDITDNRGNRKFVYSYSPGGLLNTVEAFNGSTAENRTDYVYDTAGRLTGIWAPNYDFVTFAYDAGGRLTEKWFPNGVTARYSWNADNSLAKLENSRSGG
jgi:YD repeat-containing protein